MKKQQHIMHRKLCITRLFAFSLYNQNEQSNSVVLFECKMGLCRLNPSHHRDDETLTILYINKLKLLQKIDNLILNPP